jgi:hypothetical protein
METGEITTSINDQEEETRMEEHTTEPFSLQLPIDG